MQDPLRIFRFLREEAGAGRRAALVTITAVEGASVRNPGAHMAVSESGAHIGSLSGGCIESAVIAEARSALATGKATCVRFGRGSPYIDIRLPCGGAVNLLVSPPEARPDAPCPAATLEQRLPLDLRLVMPGGKAVNVRHAPPLRIAIVGHGGTVEALAALAEAIGCEAFSWSPDPAIVDRLAPRASLLGSAANPPALPLDRWTAVACLFHDHDWEAALLAQALNGDCLYVGAMGSRITHARRCTSLRDIGVPEHRIARLHAPIGIIPSSRDPETLALSVLAEIVAAYNATGPTTLEQEGLQD
jgi:xanthine dehydrogenase accessory factor